MNKNLRLCLSVVTVLFFANEIHAQCLQPTISGATGITSSSATLNWVNPNPGASSNVALVPTGAPQPPSGPIVTGSSYTATGLTPNTSYDFYVRANCSNTAPMLITGVFDGPLTGGLPKLIEFYTVETIADLSRYGFGSASNGGGTDGVEFVFPADSIPAGTFLYLATDSASVMNYFGFAPHYINTNAPNVNGDDAIELFQDTVLIDVFGDQNVDGTGTAWEYLDGWAYRVNGDPSNWGTFTVSNWTYSSPNATDGCSANSTCTSVFPVGTYVPAAVDASPWAGPYTFTTICPTFTFATQVQDVSCVGDSTGMASVVVSGGSAPYTYAWSHGFANDTVYNLSAGNYTVMVTDANACVDQVTVTVNEPATALTADAIVMQHIDCKGDSSGAARVNITGGGSPYTISWNTNPVQMNDTIMNVPAGFYTVMVTDTNQCTVTDTISINEPQQAVDVTVQATDISCHGANDGMLVANGTGGTGTLTYMWTTNPSTINDTLDSLAGGNYTVIVTDVMGCIDSSTATITEPAALVVTGIITGLAPSGSVDISIAGGTTPYSFAWDGPSGFTANTDDITQLAEHGIYTVIVTDANGCSDTISFHVKGMGVDDHALIKPVVYPNPNDGRFTVSGLQGNDVLLKVIAIDGRIVLDEMISDGAQINLQSMSTGFYQLVFVGKDRIASMKILVQ